jgi:hypothetical protein
MKMFRTLLVTQLPEQQEMHSQEVDQVEIDTR